MIIIHEVQAMWSEGRDTDPTWSEANTIPNFYIDIRNKSPATVAAEVRDEIIAFFEGVVGSGVWPADKPKRWTLQLVGFDHSTPTTDDYGLWMLQCAGDHVPDLVDPPGTTEYVGLFHDAMLLRQGITPGTEA